jgi:GTP-binding protein LepA
MQTRNFVIIAHVDHGKSTLADRLLELTGTVEARRMKPQYLDQLELERERGITIKMAPVRMVWRAKNSGLPEDYVFHLIDTPGHSDFSYEVSRALNAVEGAILLVDVTKGIQAQTLANLRNARKAGLAVVGAVNKIDLPSADADGVARALADLLEVPEAEIFRVSGRTGEGVPELLRAVAARVPSPRPLGAPSAVAGRALIFDSLYDDHKGILAYIRVTDGEFHPGDHARLLAADAPYRVKEVGTFAPQLAPGERLRAGEIGYLATGLKEPSLVRIGDTIVAGESEVRQSAGRGLALTGYREAAPVVFISFYPNATTKFEDLERAFARLRLTDAALSIEPDANEALGRGLKVGFLGQLHFEIAASRLEREFGVGFITSFPSIAYRVTHRGETRVVKDPHEFPDDWEAVLQPMIRVEIIAPAQYLSSVMNLQQTFDVEIAHIENLGDNVVLSGTMPLAELIRDFDDQLKSSSAGFASFSYELASEAPADVEKLEILVAGEVVSALTRIVFRKDAEREARTTVERLKRLLPAQQFAQAIQARVRGRIIARETIAALRKDVTGYLYGGDRSRKMKLWKKQKRGKEKLKGMARVEVPVEVFREILKK